MSKKTHRTKKHTARPDMHAVAAADEELSRRDAERLAHLPPGGRERVLHLVAQLPGLTPDDLALLTHDHLAGDPAGGARVLAALEADGLVRPFHAVGPGGEL